MLNFLKIALKQSLNFRSKQHSNIKNIKAGNDELFIESYSSLFEVNS